MMTKIIVGSIVELVITFVLAFMAGFVYASTGFTKTQKRIFVAVVSVCSLIAYVGIVATISALGAWRGI